MAEKDKYFMMYIAMINITLAKIRIVLLLSQNVNISINALGHCSLLVQNTFRMKSIFVFSGAFAEKNKERFKIGTPLKMIRLIMEWNLTFKI